MDTKMKSRNSNSSIFLKSLLPWVVALALFMEMLDSTIVVVAIPRIASYFSVEALELNTLVISYLMGLIAILPFCRWLMDRFGAYTGFSIALAVFISGAILCTLSTSIYMLIAGRCIQGVGAGLMGTLSRSVLMIGIPKSQIIKVSGYIAVPVLLGPALGPLFGGAIVEYFDWRYLFVLNIPAGILLLIGAYFSFPKTIADIKQPLDMLGGFLLGSVLLICGYLFYSSKQFSMMSTVFMVVLMVTLLGIYSIHAKHKPEPLLRARLLANRTFGLTILIQFLLRLSLAGFPLILSLELQLNRYESPALTGFAVGFFAIGMAAARPLSAVMVNYFGVRPVLLFYGMMLPIALFMFAELSGTATYFEYCALVFICGAITSLQYGVLHVLAFVDIDKPQMPEAVTLATVAQQLGVGLGVMVATKLLLIAQLTHEVRSFTYVVQYLSIFAVLAFLPVLFLEPGLGLILREQK